MPESKEYIEHVNSLPLDELEEILFYLNKDAYPERHEIIQKRIDELKSMPEEHRPKASDDGLQVKEIKVPVDDDFVDEIANFGIRRKRNPWLNLFLFAASILLFVNCGLIQWNLRYALLIAVVVLIHELGHFFSMKIFKYDNVSVFLLPFFGGITIGRQTEFRVRDEAIVALAGPLPGIIIGILSAVIYRYSGNPIFYSVAITFIAVNGFNLFPLYPLDGGVFVDTVLFSKYPRAGAVYRCLMVLALIWVMDLLDVRYLKWIFLLYLPGLLPVWKNALAVNRVRGWMEARGLASLSLNKENVLAIEKVIDDDDDFKASKKKLKAYRLYEIFKTVNKKGISRLSRILFLLLLALSLALSGFGICYTIVAHYRRSVQYVMETAVVQGQSVMRAKMYEDGYLRGMYTIDSDKRYDGPAVLYDAAGRDSVIMNYYHGKKNGIWIYLKDDRDTAEMRAFDKGEILARYEKKSGEWKITKASDIPFLERLR